MWHYITENQLCIYMANNIEEINNWLAEHQKTIVSISNNIYHEFIIEVK